MIFWSVFCAAICHQVLDIYGERDSDEKKSESVSRSQWFGPLLLLLTNNISLSTYLLVLQYVIANLSITTCRPQMSWTLLIIKRLHLQRWQLRPQPPHPLRDNSSPYTPSSNTVTIAITTPPLPFPLLLPRPLVLPALW